MRRRAERRRHRHVAELLRQELLSYHGVDVNYLCKEVFDGLPGVDITIGDQVRALHACPVTASASAADGSLAVLTSRAVLTADSHA